MPHLQHARLDWDEQGQPLSSQFDDVYFSRHSGLEESRYVFIRHNRLPERFQAMDVVHPFVVAETGFGTGLNFLACWQCFMQHAPSEARLHFISAEKYPLDPADLKQALALWPELGAFSQQLLQHYRAIQPGYQHFVFEQGRVSLTLLVGEASTEFSRLDARVNAWFLDGFAPAKNPQMWTEELFGQLARLSAEGCSLATFTSAGFVRRGLQAAGFSMQRSPGFGRKREMLCGSLSGNCHPVTPTTAPWFARPRQPENSAKQAIIVGAGISGCATAYSLARRGWQVSLIERHSQIAREASGNPQGILYLKPSAHPTPLSQLLLAGFGYSRRLLANWPDNPHFDCCGLLQLAFNDKELRRQQQLAQCFDAGLLQAVNAAQASELAGVRLDCAALFYPESGWINPAELCKQLVGHANIHLLCGRQTGDLQYNGQHWQALDEQGRTIASAPVAIIAAANEVRRFRYSSWLPLKSIQGQTSSLPATASSQSLQRVVSAQGYIAPACGGRHCLGASFDFERTDTEVLAQVHLENLQRLRELGEDLCQRLDIDNLDMHQLSGHAALRCTSPDYLPVFGPLADRAGMLSAYERLRQDARSRINTPCPWFPGLYVNTAHGSRGMITAPLAGEVLAAWINGEALPLPVELLEACHPNRFVIRSLKRNQPEQPA